MLPRARRVILNAGPCRASVARTSNMNTLLNRMIAILIVLAVASGSVSGNDKLKIGDAAPDWNDLTGIDDKQHSLKDLHDKSVVVVCFTCNSCPYAVDYEDRLIALHEKYADPESGVIVVAINANRKPSETLDKMKDRAKEKEFPFAYLIDETQQVADSYGAVYTPEFFVLNKDRKVVYIGALDDKTDAKLASVNYVELAIEAVLADKLPETTEVPARGCAIPYKRARK